MESCAPAGTVRDLSARLYRAHSAWYSRSFETHHRHHLLALEFLLAAIALLSNRGIEFCDTRIAEEFTRQLSIDVMQHAGNIDLESIEDPAIS